MNDRTATLSRPRLALALLVTLLLLVSSTCPAAEPALPKKVVSIEGITEYRLDNGLRILLFPDPASPNVTVNLTVFVGSRHEGYGETGMAHLLEHMLFKGTPLHPQVPRILKEHGAQYNGTTSYDRTNYFETMDGTDENLEFGIRLEADRLVNSYVKREDLISEMTVVRNEFEMGENDPETILNQRMMAAAYEWHNYGKTTIGNRSDIERVPIDNLQAFYKKHYQPDNAMLVVAGKFDPDKALAYIGKYFGALKQPARKLDTTYTEEPAQDGERTVVLRRVGKIGAVGVLYHICAGAHDDFPALQVLGNILDSEPSGRLYKALVESKKATSVGGYAYGLHDPGVLEFFAQVDKSSTVPAVQETLLATIDRLRTEPATEAEVARSKQQILKDRELLMSKSNRIGVQLSEWAAKGDWRLFFLHRDRVAKVTAADVDRVIKTYLVRTNQTVGLYFPTDKPERAEIPPTPVVAELVKNYQGTQTIAAGESFEPTPENIEKHVQRFELPNGLKVALLPKKNRGESVVAELTLRYGNPESIKGHTSATQFLAPLMTRGTKKHNRQQIEDELDRLRANLEGGGLLGTATFDLETKRESLPAVLKLLGEMLREPTLPAEDFDVLRRETRDGLVKASTDPHALAFRESLRRLSPYPKDDVRYVPTTEESIARLDAVKVEEVRQLHTEQLGAQAGTLVVVGDFDAEAIRKLATELLGDWKAQVPYQRIERPARTEVPGAHKDILTPDKANAVYTAGHMIAMTDADPDYPALEVANFLFGGGGLSSRLANRVRQQEGLSYGIGSRFSADAKDKAARFGIFAITNPANIDKVDKAVTEELDKLLKEGVSSQELEEAKSAYLKQLKVQRASDQALVGMLGEELFNGRTLAFYADIENKIGSLKTDEVNAAVRKHWLPKKLVIIHAGDFKKKVGEKSE